MDINSVVHMSSLLPFEYGSSCYTINWCLAVVKSLFYSFVQFLIVLLRAYMPDYFHKKELLFYRVKESEL